MKQLNLIANDTQEQKVLAYLQEHVSDVLADKINNGTLFEKDGHALTNKKTLSGFMNYACDEAQKLAAKNARSVCVDDEIVFGWALHYFEEESIEGTLYTLDGAEYKPAPRKTSKPITKEKQQPQKPQSVQFSLFDNLTETGVQEPDTYTLSAETDKNNNESDIIEPVKEEPECSPLWTKYKGYQAEHPTAVVAYRLGDFYEVFDEYAVLIADDLCLTLTSRDFGLSKRVPMVGFPYHASENYFAKIVKKHDLYIIETDTEKQFIQKNGNVDNEFIDEDTGEILTEEEMQEFDGDISEPIDIGDLEEVSDDPILSQLITLFDNALEVK